MGREDIGFVVVLSSMHWATTGGQRQVQGLKTSLQRKSTFVILFSILQQDRRILAGCNVLLPC